MVFGLSRKKSVSAVIRRDRLRCLGGKQVFRPWSGRGEAWRGSARGLGGDDFEPSRKIRPIAALHGTEAGISPRHRAVRTSFQAVPSSC